MEILPLFGATSTDKMRKFTRVVSQSQPKIEKTGKPKTENRPIWLWGQVAQEDQGGIFGAEEPEAAPVQQDVTASSSDDDLVE